MSESVDTKSLCEKCGRLHSNAEAHQETEAAGKTIVYPGHIEAGVLNVPIEDGTERDSGKADDLHPRDHTGYRSKH